MASKKIYRAGLIPLIKEGDEIRMLFMKPSKQEYGGDVFQIAKGKQEDGESMEETAIREAKEELGLFRGNIEHLESIGEWLGRTTIFVARITDRDMFGDPHFETGETKWMTLDEFVKEGRDLHKPIVKAAHRKILRVLETYRARKIKEDLAVETPQWIPPTEFEYDVPEHNKAIAKIVLSDPDAQVLSKQDDVTLIKLDTTINLIDTKEKELLYRVDYEIENIPDLGGTVTTQHVVWRGRDARAAGFPKFIFFNYLLKNTGAIMTDSQQTFKRGSDFWLNRINDAFGMNLNVYFFKEDEPQIVKKINNLTELQQLSKQYDIWNHAPKSRRRKLIITDRTVKETPQ